MTSAHGFASTLKPCRYVGIGDDEEAEKEGRTRDIGMEEGSG